MDRTVNVIKLSAADSLCCQFELPAAYPIFDRSQPGEVAESVRGANRSIPLGFVIHFTPYQPMPAKRKAGLAQPSTPSVSRPNRGRVVEQTVFLLLLVQSRKLGLEGMIGREEGLLAMEDRRIWAGVVFEAIDRAHAGRQFDATEQGRVRIGLEMRIHEVRDSSGLTVHLDEVCPVINSSEVAVDGAGISAAFRCALSRTLTVEPDFVSPPCEGGVRGGGGRSQARG
jgi:hypothetical protein